jgi:hypothetical protein
MHTGKEIECKSIDGTKYKSEAIKVLSTKTEVLEQIVIKM